MQPRPASPLIGWMTRIIVIMLCGLVLSSCGFHLRGSSALSNNALSFSLLAADFGHDQQLANALARQLRLYGTSLQTVHHAPEALRLQILQNSREREILSLSGAGKVREYLLLHRFVFKVTDAKGQELLPLTRLDTRREYTFDDQRILAKEQEEQLLYQDMAQDIAQQVMERLTTIRPPRN